MQHELLSNKIDIKQYILIVAKDILRAAKCQ